MSVPTVQSYAAPVVAPYVTPAQFSVYPTWLDVDDLVPGGPASVETNVLADVLLTATQWAVNTVDQMPLHAHLNTEQTTTRVDRAGRIHLHPRHIPVRSVAAVSFGPDPTSMTALTLPDASQWIEDGRQVSYTLPGSAASILGPGVQFGPLLMPEQRIYVQWTYIAGFVNTTLSADAASAATALTAADPTGIQAGNLLRIWDNANSTSEAVYAAPTWTPPAVAWPPAPASVTLASPLQFAHATGVGIADMPRDILQAVIMYAVSLLLREDVSAEDPFAGSQFSPSVRRASSGGKAGGLVTEAESMLAVYRPSRWGM